MSPQLISCLKAEWQAEYEPWPKRDLTARLDVYFWADGVYLQGDALLCQLV